MTVILGKLKIKADEESVIELVDRNFPDMRSILNKIQSFSIQGVTELNKDKIQELNWDFEDLYKILVGQPNPVQNYQFVQSNYSSMVEDVMSKCGDEFIEWVSEKHPDKAKFIPSIIITVADHQAKRHQVIDPSISLLSLCFSIQKILN